MAFQIKFNTTALDGVGTWEEDLPSRVDAERFPRRQGAVVSPVPFLAERIIRCTCEIDKASQTDLINYLRNLLAKLNVGEGQLYLRDDNSFLYAVKRNWSHAYDGNKTPALRSRYSIEFVAGDPYWYSSTLSTNTQSSIASSPFSYSITNNGLESTPVKIEIQALLSNRTGTFKMTDTTHGLNWIYTGTINNNQILTVDNLRDVHRVLNAGADALGNWIGSWWMLLPGTNNISYEGPPSVAITISWRDRWSV